MQERRTTIKGLVRSTYGQITPRTAELPALEQIKTSMYNVVSTLDHFYYIFLILTGNEDSHKISDAFEIWPDRTKECEVICPLKSINRCIHIFSVAIDQIIS